MKGSWEETPGTQTITALGFDEAMTSLYKQRTQQLCTVARRYLRTPGPTETPYYHTARMLDFLSPAECFLCHRVILVRGFYCSPGCAPLSSATRRGEWEENKEQEMTCFLSPWRHFPGERGLSRRRQGTDNFLCGGNTPAPE
ncbi:unnamed protein product [Arctogadus glacialis]